MTFSNTPGVCSDNPILPSLFLPFQHLFLSSCGHVSVVLIIGRQYMWHACLLVIRGMFNYTQSSVVSEAFIIYFTEMQKVGTFSIILVSGIEKAL